MPLTTLAEIIEAAWALSPAERLQLLDAMWDAEHPETWPVRSPEWHREILKARRESPAAWLAWEETKTSLRQLADDVNKGIAQIERGETVPFDLDALKAALRERLRENDEPA